MNKTLFTLALAALISAPAFAQRTPTTDVASTQQSLASCPPGATACADVQQNADYADATINQSGGTGNVAGISQTYTGGLNPSQVGTIIQSGGGNNRAFLTQTGSGETGRITQTGSGNYGELFQHTDGTTRNYNESFIEQTGHDNTAEAFGDYPSGNPPPYTTNGGWTRQTQMGDDNRAFIIGQEHPTTYVLREAVQTQVGSGNYAEIDETGEDRANYIRQTQDGDENRAIARGAGYVSFGEQTQTGSNNKAEFTAADGPNAASDVQFSMTQVGDDNEAYVDNWRASSISGPGHTEIVTRQEGNANYIWANANGASGNEINVAQYGGTSAADANDVLITFSSTADNNVVVVDQGTAAVDAFSNTAIITVGSDGNAAIVSQNGSSNTATVTQN